MVSAEWLADITGTDVTYDLPRPGLAGRGVGVALPGHTIEFVSPTGEGPMTEFLAGGGERIHSLSYAVADLAAARAHLDSVGVATLAGSVDAAVLLHPDATEGARFELTAG
jgi:hypothetical protein